MQEYRPKEVRVNLKDLSAIVVIDSKKDAEELIKKYNEFILYKVPKFDFNLMVNQAPVANPQMVPVPQIPPKKINTMPPMQNHNMFNPQMMKPGVMNPNMMIPNMINPQVKPNMSMNMPMNHNKIFINDTKHMQQPFNQNMNQMMNNFQNMSLSNLY